MCPAFAISQPSRTLANLTQGQDAKVEHRLIGGVHPRLNSPVGFGADQLENAVRVEQKSAHSSISRPASLFRCKSSLRPKSGDCRKNCTMLLGWRDLTIRLSYCSSE